MLRILFILSLLLVTMRASAQQQTLDQYWQTLYGNALGQCGASLVALAKQLDDAKARIKELEAKEQK